MSEGRDRDGNPFTLDDARGIYEAYKAEPGADPVSIAVFERMLPTTKVETDVPVSTTQPEAAPAATVTPTPGKPPTVTPAERLTGFKAFLEQGPDQESIFAQRDDILSTHPQLSDDLNKVIIEHEGNKLKGGQVNEPLQAETPVEREPVKQEKAPDFNTKTFIENKIRQLGSIEAVNAFYTGTDAVSDYARTVAPRVLGVESQQETIPEPAPAAQPSNELPPGTDKEPAKTEIVQPGAKTPTDRKSVV
jgi:hypothetical protein